MDLRNYVLDVIYNIEKKFPVDTWQYANIEIWPIFRMKIEQEFFKLYVTTKDKTTYDLTTRLRSYLKEFFYYMKSNSIDIENNAEIVNEQGGAVFCGFSNNRGIIIDGRYYDIFCDPFIEQFKINGVSSLILEQEHTETSKIPRYNKSKYIVRELILYIIRNSYKIPMYLLQGWQFPKTEKKEFIHQLSEFGIDGEKILKEIPYYVILVKMISNYYKQSILQPVKPIIAFVVGFYSILKFPFVLACRQINIPIVDIQHGLQNNLYDDFMKVPTHGYELLPNYFWCWNEKKTIFKYVDGYDRDIHKNIHGGNLWIEKWKNNTLPDGWIVNYDREFAVKGNGKFNILYTLMLGLSTPRHLIDVINCSPLDWLWWIRLHPRMNLERNYNSMEEIIDSVKKKNVIFEEATSMPLLSLLRNVDVHITRFSAVVLDAEQMNVPSIVVDENYISAFSEQISRGIVSKALTYEELFNMLNEIKENRPNIRVFDNVTQKRVSVIDLLELVD